MSALEDRKTVIRLIGEAISAGARQAPACSILGLSERTVQRWLCGEPDALDGRSTRHYEPSHKLSADERAELLAVANSAEFGHLPPSQIVPRLADQQRYIASESTFYRVLRDENQLAHRRSERAPRSCSKPRAVAADAPNQLYSWDITYLPSAIRGQYFYLYLFMDVFSHALRKSVKIFCSTSTSRYDDHPASAGGQRRCPQHEAVGSRLTAVPSLPTGSPRASPSA
ncbi:Homeodomain-like domain-containing protein [Burkholderia sp. D7]|nr:Homeodomain-like domain-containing protein [Burkholderia sp. D7]